MFAYIINYLSWRKRKQRASSRPQYGRDGRGVATGIVDCQAPVFTCPPALLLFNLKSEKVPVKFPGAEMQPAFGQHDIAEPTGLASTHTTLAETTGTVPLARPRVSDCPRDWSRQLPRQKLTNFDFSPWADPRLNAKCVSC